MPFGYWQVEEGANLFLFALFLLFLVFFLGFLGFFRRSLFLGFLLTCAGGVFVGRRLFGWFLFVLGCLLTTGFLLGGFAAIPGRFAVLAASGLAVGTSGCRSYSAGGFGRFFFLFFLVLLGGISIAGTHVAEVFIRVIASVEGQVLEAHSILLLNSGPDAKPFASEAGYTTLCLVKCTNEYGADYSSRHL